MKNELKQTMMLSQFPGILVIGGELSTVDQSVEFWSPADNESCVLKDYPRNMFAGPTVNLVSEELVACYRDSCDIYNNGEWNHLVDTRERRKEHSSAVKDDRLLLIGGRYSSSAEWIPTDGSPSQPGPFDIRHGFWHCTLQISTEIIIVTGGAFTESYVTEYHLNGDGNETPLTPMTQRRRVHACGVYRGAGGEQVRRVCNFNFDSISMVPITNHHHHQHDQD